MVGVTNSSFNTRERSSRPSPICVVGLTMRSDVFSELSLSTLISAMKNHWLAAGVVMFLTLALAVLAMIFLPRKYHSEAMIFVKLGRETVSLDPTASTGSMISVLDTRDNEINSIRDMLYSRGLAEKVVDRLGPEVILGDAPLTEENQEDNFVAGTDYKNSPRQKAIKELTEDTEVISARKSSVLVLTADAASPELAQRILVEYLDIYQTMHTGAHQTPQSNRFFEEQAKLLKIQWEESMKALQIAKEDAGVVSIQGVKDNLRVQTHEAESRLMSVKSQLSANRASVKKFDAIIERNPLDKQSVRGSYLSAKSQLSALEAEKSAIDSALEGMLQRAAKLNRDEVTIGALEQEVELAANNFAQYQELYEQTRIEEALHNKKFTNVRIVQEPSFIPKPISPKKTIIGLAGIVAGSTGAVLLALMLELFFTPSRPEEEGGQQVSEPDYPDNDEFSLTKSGVFEREVVDSANG